MEFVILSAKDGAIECTGYHADNEDEALDMFLAEHPAYSANDYYAAES